MCMCVWGGWVGVLTVSLPFFFAYNVYTNIDDTTWPHHLLIVRASPLLLMNACVMHSLPPSHYFLSTLWMCENISLHLTLPDFAQVHEKFLINLLILFIIDLNSFLKRSYHLGEMEHLIVFSLFFMS